MTYVIAIYRTDNPEAIDFATSEMADELRANGHECDLVSWAVHDDIETAMLIARKSAAEDGIVLP